MAPPSRPWFRFYTEALYDRKLRRLKPEQRWLWVAVLGAARQSSRPGHLLVSDDEPMEAEDLADIAAMPAEDVERTLPLFDRAGMIHRDPESGAWVVTNWGDRQFESDNTTARTRRHRAKERSMERSMERSIAVPGNDSPAFDGTPPDTETDTDNPPNPPQSGGHHGQHPNCRACGTSPRASKPKPPDPMGRTAQAARERAERGMAQAKAVMAEPVALDAAERIRQIRAQHHLAEHPPSTSEEPRLSVVEGGG